jgi:hypothetical protein
MPTPFEDGLADDVFGGAAGVSNVNELLALRSLAEGAPAARECAPIRAATSRTARKPGGNAGAMARSGSCRHIGAARHRLKARLRPGGQTAFLAERLFAIDSAKKHERVTADLL